MSSSELVRFIEQVERHVDDMDHRIVLDIGSRDLSAAMAFKYRWPSSRVYAFECNPLALQRCSNMFDLVELFPYAVLDRNGKTDFWAIDPERTRTSHRDGNIGASSVYRANPEYPYETYEQNLIEVECLRLDDWSAAVGIGAIDVVWMDIQGAELQALHGMGQLLKTVKVIQMEVEHKRIYLDQPLFPEVDRFMTEAGFRCIAEYRHSDWASDVIYVQKNHH